MATSTLAYFPFHCGIVLSAFRCAVHRAEHVSDIDVRELECEEERDSSHNRPETARGSADNSKYNKTVIVETMY